MVVIQLYIKLVFIHSFHKYLAWVLPLKQKYILVFKPQELIVLLQRTLVVLYQIVDLKHLHHASATDLVLIKLMHDYILRRPPSVLYTSDDADTFILRNTNILIYPDAPGTVYSNIKMVLYLILDLQDMYLRMDWNIISVTVVQLMRVWVWHHNVSDRKVPQIMAVVKSCLYHDLVSHS